MQLVTGDISIFPSFFKIKKTKTTLQSCRSVSGFCFVLFNAGLVQLGNAQHPSGRKRFEAAILLYSTSNIGRIRLKNNL